MCVCVCVCVCVLFRNDMGAIGVVKVCKVRVYAFELSLKCPSIFLSDNSFCMNEKK